MSCAGPVSFFLMNRTLLMQRQEPTTYKLRVGLDVGNEFKSNP